MTKVYCLFESVPYEGWFLVAVYDTPALAEEARAAYEKCLRERDYPGREDNHLEHAVVKELEVNDVEAFCRECGMRETGRHVWSCPDKPPPPADSTKDEG